MLKFKQREKPLGIYLFHFYQNKSKKFKKLSRNRLILIFLILFIITPAILINKKFFYHDRNFIGYHEEIITDSLNSTELKLGRTDVGGQITSDTNWAKVDSPYIVSSNLLVSQGVTLTIEPGVLIKFEYGITMQIDGCLIAIGTETESIIFTSNQTSPNSGDWRSLKFTSDSNGATYDIYENYLDGSIMSYCLIEYAGYSNTPALDLDESAPFIDHCNIINNYYTGVDIMYCNLIIANSEITYNNLGGNAFGYGIKIQGAAESNVIIKDSVISNNKGKNGIIIYGDGSGGSEVILRGNTISDNQLSSIFYSESGISINNNPIVIITDNVISGHIGTYGGGIDVFSGEVTIRNNHISNNHVYSGYWATEGGGIYVGSGDVIIERNNITRNSGGIKIKPYNTEIYIHHNNINGNYGNGIYLSDTIFVSSVNIAVHYNNLYNNTPYDAINENGDNVDINATYNWWGTISDTEIQSNIYDWSDDGFVGLVIYKPYLDAPVSFDIVDMIEPAQITDLRIIELTETGFIYPVGKSEPYIYAGWLATNESNPPYIDGYYHLGQDMEAEVGDPVFAITGGEIIYVSKSGWGVSNYGLLIKHKLDSGQEFLALYGHVRPIRQDLYYLQSDYVNPPISVERSEVFATIGPYDTIPHLHFGIRPGSDVPPAPWGMMNISYWDATNGFVNPMDWIRNKTPYSPINPGDSIILSWTAPGDDGIVGNSSGYEVKYSSAGPITEFNWNSATSYQQLWIPLEAGKTEVHVISNLKPNTEYWFAIRAYDEEPNYGDISNSPNGKTLTGKSVSASAISGYPLFPLGFIIVFMFTIIVFKIKRRILCKKH